MNRLSPIQRLSAILAALVTLAALSGCMQSTGTVSTDPTSYIRFLGAEKGDTASVDGATAVALDPDKPLLITPGKRHIQVSRGGSTVLEKDVMVSDLQTLEVRLP